MLSTANSNAGQGEGKGRGILHALSPQMPTPRVLGLHGWGSSNLVTELQTGSIELDQVATVEFLQGPYASEPFDSMLEDAYCWHKEGEPLRHALEHVAAHVRSHGPYDGVYAFSQAGGIVALLSDDAVRRSLGFEAPLWRFAIVACGADQLMRLQAPAVEKPIAVPSLHLVGELDLLRPDSEVLATRFDQPLVVYHPYGHELPLQLMTQRPIVDKVRDFVQAPH